ncbi:PIG-L deacetylase family protein [Cylindrospermopsis raciborskii]|uniref:PIG-L deacetylase family protein n=1 Tax=Cylindrospermopsis raciborskii TaxID=77022 RepID=UPI0021197339|nr:PIG-L family deacetylase [Cylindrospermopsis raciborskii]
MAAHPDDEVLGCGGAIACYTAQGIPVRVIFLADGISSTDSFIMKLLSPQPWINFLSLLPGTVLTFLTITVAFLRFYDEQDFSVLGYITQPRV